MGDLDPYERYIQSMPRRRQWIDDRKPFWTCSLPDRQQPEVSA